MNIRPAVTEDAREIAAIWNPIIRDSELTFNSVEKSVDELGRLIERKADSGIPVLVAVRDSICGFAHCGQFRNGVGYAYTFEHTIMLLEKDRRQGCGKHLMAELERSVRCVGGHSMIAGITEVNLAGMSFHRSIGFAEVARLPSVGFKFGRWYDLVLMQKFL